MKMVGPATLVALVLSSVSAMTEIAPPTASSLIHARTVYEDQVHVQLARWCNATLPAQTSRRSALQRLLEQAQTTAGKSPKLVALEQDVASMGDSLEKQRISAEAAQAAEDRHALEAKLDLSDASADVKALSAAAKIIDAKQGTPGFKSVQGLLTQAQTTERQLQTKAQLLQTTGSSSGASAKAQAEYQSKKAEKDQMQHLFFTTQRSLGVLTSALEDESAYLSDLQSICGAEQHVEHRLQGSTLPELNKVLMESEKPVPVSAIQVAPQTAPPVPVVHAAATTAAPAPVVQEVATTAAPAPKKVPPVAMMEKQDSATEETVHPKKAAPVAHAHVAAKAKAVAQTPPPAADDDDSDDDAPAAATTTLPPTTTQLKHKKHHKKHHKAAAATTTTAPPATTAPPTTTAKPEPAVTTTLSDDDAEEQAMEALQGPPKTEAAAPPLAAKAAAPAKVATSSVQKTVKKHKHTTAAPADDVDSDDAQASATTAAPTTTEAPTTTVAPDPAEPAGSADDDDFSHPKDGVQAFVAKKKKAHHKKKTEKKKDEFLDGIYSAAAGYMPPTYSAWKPEGASSAPHTPPPLAAGKNAMDSMKAMMDTGGDDDSTNIDQALKVEVPKHEKWAPSPPPPAAGQSQPAAHAAPATAVAPAAPADGDDPFDESPAANTPAPTTTAQAAKASDAYDLSDDSDSSPAAPPATTTQPPPPPPAASASKDPFADADDSDAPPPTEAPHHHKKKKHHTTTAAPAADPFGDDEDASSTTVAPKPKVSLEQTSSAADPDVPDQYAAWSPNDKPADPKKNSMVQSFESGFDDGDAAPTKKKHLRHKKHHTTTPAPAADSDGVVYDDDDLPKHHAKPFAGLEGGWKAFMKPKTEKAKPKLDADVQIMQNLYTDDGGLPNQYTAWTPAAATTAAPAPVGNDAAPDDSDDADDGGDSFMQMESRKKVSDPVARLISAAVSAASDDADAPALIEEATVAVDASRMQAANAVLAQFAQTLQSKPLQQLVQAKLSPPKLAALFQKLQSVDPLKHPSHSSEQAEQACLFFEDNAQSAAPVTQASFKVEKGSNDVAEALSHQSALLEEMSARTQLQRTMEQDVSSLTTLLKTARQGQDISGLSTAEAQLDKEGRTSSGAELGVAAEGVQDAHAELADMLELTLQKRSLALKTQETKVALLQTEQKAVNSNVVQKRSLASQSEAEMKAAEQKLSGIQSACGQALASLEQRRHTGHMEAHAIGTVLKVVGTL